MEMERIEGLFGERKGQTWIYSVRLVVHVTSSVHFKAIWYKVINTLSRELFYILEGAFWLLLGNRTSQKKGTKG